MNGVANSFSMFFAPLNGNTYYLKSPTNFPPNPQLYEKFKNWPAPMVPRGQPVTALDKHFMGTVYLSSPKK